MSIKKYKLDKDELEIEKAIELGVHKSIKNLSKEKTRYQKIAKAHGNKVKRINLRVTAWDKAQEKAMMEGLPYQTFLASVLHKYLSGQFIDRKAIKVK